MKISVEHYDMLRYSAMSMADTSAEMLQMADGELDIVLCDEDHEAWIDVVMDLDNAYKRATSEK